MKSVKAYMLQQGEKVIYLPYLALRILAVSYAPEAKDWRYLLGETKQPKRYELRYRSDMDSNETTVFFYHH